jgi:hypothetical protein
MTHLRVHTPTNIYGVPQLHLNKLQIVLWNVLGHHCIFTFVIFATTFERVQQSFVHHCFIFFVTCHMILKFVFNNGFLFFKWHNFGPKFSQISLLCQYLSLQSIDLLELRCGFESITCCFPSVHNFVYLFMHLGCCLLIVCVCVCVFTTISMMEWTISTPLLININSLFNIEEDNEFASQT